MRLIMNDEQLQTLEQVKQFPEGIEAPQFRSLTTQEKYGWVEEVLMRFKYHRLKGNEQTADPFHQIKAQAHRR